MVKIAQISCGTEYSGIQDEIVKAAATFGAEIVIPDVELDYINEAYQKFGFTAASSGIRLMVARAMSIVEGKSDADAVFIATCFRCAEGALLRNEIRRFIQQNTNLPVVTYSFTERTKADELFIRMEALSTIVARKSLLAREKQEGLTLGIDSGSTTTKVVLMEDNKIIGTGWLPTTDVIDNAHEGTKSALEGTGYKQSDIEAIGVTGYGRLTIGKHLNADLIQEELSVNSKGAVFLADRQKGEATVLDIGGMDNKVITVNDGIPDNFTMGGICAGASGRFLEITSRRLGVDISELGPLALKGDHNRALLNSYCIVFGIQDLVTSLAAGSTKEDVAAAACFSVAQQVYEQQLQEIDVREPLIQVGGTSLITGLVDAVSQTLGNIDIIVPEYSQYIGAVGSALIVSGLGKMKD
ncbi:MAG: methanogenesis marker 15 protein [Methanobacteriaceae archaeon]|jgi:putative methanogenesis marker protein 15|nr:methanogenesis marker 15 protein [Methanobacteriaceae archaeon]OPY23045.1 MAG: BadF/BadG/BcrA/BcrD ATPase family protein [Methanobacterium sp. PtaU1.Bin097]